MEPWEVMTSESQERMLAIVTPESWPAVAAICAKWEVRATVIGTVTEPEPDGGGRLRIRDGMDGPVLADVPAASLSDDAPLYDRPRRGAGPRRAAPPAPTDRLRRRPPRAAALAGLGLPPVRPPALPQHRGRTGRRRRAAPPGRPRAAGLGARRGAHDRLQPPGLRARPAGRHGARAGRGRGQPGLRRRHAGRRGQLPELRQPRAPRGHVAALRVHRRHGRGLSRPVAPGHRRERQPLQRERRVRHRPHAGARAARPRRRRARAAAGAGVVARATRSCWSGRAAAADGAFPLEGTRWATERRDHRSGRIPSVDFAAHAAACAFVAALVAAQVAGPDRTTAMQLVHAVHDVSGGGLAIALAEMAAAAGTGCTLDARRRRRALHRVAVALRGGHRVTRRAVPPGPRRAGIPAAVLGPAGGERFTLGEPGRPAGGGPARGARGESGPRPGRAVMAAAQACARMGGA